MRVNDDFPDVNVERQSQEPDSVLAFWKQMLQLRKDNKELLVYGSFTMHDLHDPDVFTFVKEAVDGQAMLVVCNFSDGDQPIEAPDPFQHRARKILVSTAGTTDAAELLAPWEARVYVLERRVRTG